MKAIVIGDIHGRHEDLSLPLADVLIHAGDITRGRDIGFNETIAFLDWFEDQPHKHKLFILGNHEKYIEANYDNFLQLLKQYPTITYLHHNSVAIDGVNFYRSNYSVEFCGWAFMEDDLDLTKEWDLIPKDTNVLITHTPSYGRHDLVKRSYGRDPHVGSKSLAERLKALQGSLRVHVCGHLHESHGASVLDERYNLVNSPTITLA